MKKWLLGIAFVAMTGISVTSLFVAQTAMERVETLEANVQHLTTSMRTTSYQVRPTTKRYSKASFGRSRPTKRSPWSKKGFRTSRSYKSSRPRSTSTRSSK